MVNLAIRKNEHCIIGLPSCGYVFNSSKSCFIGYGFRESALEKDILIQALTARGIEPVEAGGSIAPGKYAFCHKICSKIIVSQFCVVILNNDITKIDGTVIERPNANVNMEFGLMLGHNKYVIPFQRDDQTLPFNVSGLDTVKYNPMNFKALAERAIDHAISETVTAAAVPPIDRSIEAFLLARNYVISPIEAQGDRDIYRLGSPMGFNLITAFNGIDYAFLGNFTNINAEFVIWRLGKLYEIIKERLDSVPQRAELGFAISPEQYAALNYLANTLKVIVIVTGDEQASQIQNWLSGHSPTVPTEILSISDVWKHIERIVPQ